MILVGVIKINFKNYIKTVIEGDLQTDRQTMPLSRCQLAVFGGTYANFFWGPTAFLTKLTNALLLAIFSQKVIAAAMHYRPQ